jgi:hypothetical protein
MGTAIPCIYSISLIFYFLIFFNLLKPLKDFMQCVKSSLHLLQMAHEDVELHWMVNRLLRAGDVEDGWIQAWTANRRLATWRL